MSQSVAASPVTVEAPPRRWTRAAAPLLLLATVQLSIHLVTNRAYGFHTDELYYIISGQHPAWGYVDFPPVTPMLARLDTSIFGISPWTLRLFPAVVSAVVVFLTGLCALELGGSRRASFLASLVALLCPLLLGTWLFQTVVFDQLTWMIAIYLLLRIVRTGNGRLFIPLGVDLGVGLQTKFTIIGLCIGIAAVVVTSPNLRRFLRLPYPWIGLAIAVLCLAPNIAWQIANGFPTLAYTHHHGGDIAHGGGIVSFAAVFILTMGPLFLPLWTAGLVFLFRHPQLRPMGILTVVAILLFLPDGKGYYPAPTIPLVLAAGCVAISRVVPVIRRRWLTGLTIGAGLLEAPLLATILLPVVPAPSMHRLGVDTKNPDFANTVGWPQMVAQVGAVYNALPSRQRARTSILASIDGEAGAIDIYGRREHLPQAISPHLNFWYWKPANLDATTLVTVGYRRSDLAFLCGMVVRAGTVTVPDSIVNLEQGAPILVCTHLRESINVAWPKLKNFS